MTNSCSPHQLFISSVLQLGNWAWVYPAHFAGLTQQKLLSGYIFCWVDSVRLPRGAEKHPVRATQLVNLRLLGQLSARLLGQLSARSLGQLSARLLGQLSAMLCVHM